ncbi:hypothetical protein T4C_6370 [Trichinella pseudospiralis]|uniref:Uncharacterized protein n=1 Tax=Trichinella pseudospiralis TaxID=6337 RepID=A0A0V1IXP2_TRIPS|nr:hypothetical protein T4C_6370 [Trichinella pseudospiralis]
MVYHYGGGEVSAVDSSSLCLLVMKGVNKFSYSKKSFQEHPDLLWTCCAHNPKSCSTNWFKDICNLGDAVIIRVPTGESSSQSANVIISAWLCQFLKTKTFTMRLELMIPEHLCATLTFELAASSLIPSGLETCIVAFACPLKEC